MNIEKAKESLKRIKTSHYTAMTWLGVDKPDVETQEAIKVVEKEIYRW